jgi:hypothetical protein
MKAFRILTLIGLMATLLTYSSCKKDDPEPEPLTDIQLGKLAKTWKINTVTLDNVDKLSDYTNFTLTLTGTKGNTSFGYSTANRPSLSPWKASGSWEFGASPETQMIRDKGTADELAMTYSVNETTLSITFTFNGAGYSRTGVVKGQWVYTFKL